MIIPLLQLFAINDPGQNFTGVALFDGLLKAMFVIGFGLYTVFAFIVTRQISNMRRTLSTSASFPIRVVGYLHLLMAVVLFLGAVLLL